MDITSYLAIVKKAINMITSLRTFVMFIVGPTHRYEVLGADKSADYFEPIFDIIIQTAVL